MALIIRGIDSEARACILDAFGYQGFLGGLWWGINDKAEDFLKEKGIAFDVEFEHGVKILNVTEWIKDEVLDELDEIADERLSDDLAKRAYYGHKHSVMQNSLEEYIQFYGEELD